MSTYTQVMDTWVLIVCPGVSGATDFACIAGIVHRMAYQTCLVGALPGAVDKVRF